MKREAIIEGIDMCFHVHACINCPLYPHEYEYLCDAVQELVDNCSEFTVDTIKTMIKEVE